MNSSSPLHDSATEQQASLWAARLEGGTLDAADRAALDTWLAAQPARRALLSDYCQFSADLERQLPSLVSSGAVKMPAAAPPARRRWRLSWPILASGTLAAAAVVALVFALSPSPRETETLATSVAQRQSFTLGDGTRVELNAQTSLLVENSRGERRVRLASGEAFFAVAKDKSRPFIVETPTGSVRVTGTVFNVRTDKISELDVIVVEGSVHVRPAGGASPRDPAPLTAGQRLSASLTGVTVSTLAAGAVEDALAWRQGLIVFDRVPLREAVARFAHYHGRGVSVSDAAAAGQFVGGRFSLDDFDGFLAGLEEPFRLRIARDLSGTVRLNLRTEK